MSTYSPIYLLTACRDGQLRPNTTLTFAVSKKANHEKYREVHFPSLFIIITAGDCSHPDNLLVEDNAFHGEREFPEPWVNSQFLCYEGILIVLILNFLRAIIYIHISGIQNNTFRYHITHHTNFTIDTPLFPVIVNTRASLQS